MPSFEFKNFTFRYCFAETVLVFFSLCVIIIFMQIWFIGRTLASQAGKAGPTPVICFFIFQDTIWALHNCNVCPNKQTVCHYLCNSDSVRHLSLHNRFLFHLYTIYMENKTMPEIILHTWKKAAVRPPFIMIPFLFDF